MARMNGRKFVRTLGILTAVVLTGLGLSSCGSSDHSYSYELSIGHELRFIRIDGADFFPVGMYSAMPKDVDDTLDSLFEELREAGFNTVQSYWGRDYDLEGYLEKCEQHALKALVYPKSAEYVIRPTLQAKLIDSVNQLRQYPILAWYLVDEPDLNGVAPDTIAASRDIIREHDPNHSTALVVYDSLTASEYSGCTDIMMVDTYPIGYDGTDRPLRSVGEDVGEALVGVDYQKPVWSVTQAFGHSWGWQREPTRDEMRFMTYDAIIHGATGLFYYTYNGSQYYIKDNPTHWQDLKDIVSELKQMLPVLTKQPYTGIRVDSNQIHFTAKNNDGAVYLIAENVSESDAIAEFVLPSAGSIEVMFENRNLPRGSTLVDSFEGNEVHVYRIVP